MKTKTINYTLFGTIANLERINNTRNGNPRREVVITTETQGSYKAKTKGDYSFASRICQNREGKRCGVEFTESTKRIYITDLSLI